MTLKGGAGRGAGEALGRAAGRGRGVEATAAGRRLASLECERGADPREAVFRAAVERGWVLLELATRARRRSRTSSCA